jgi:DNA-binding SARP family transcriptional activator
MARLHLRLLGGFVARLASGEACRLPTKKTRALVAYLALPAGRFHSRDKLTALLWGDTAESQARHSFRQALLTLRRALGDGHSPALLIQEDTVALNPEAVTVDAQAFEVALAAGSPDDLERAAALYAGHLLEGFGLDEAPFEEWRVLEGERLRELALEGLTRLLREHVRADRVEPAVHTAQQLLGMDPLQEAVHRALMRLFIRQGRRAAALRQYQACVDALARELATEPDEETRGLYREILRGGSRAVARPVRPVGSAPLAGDGRPPRAESSLVGRGAELATLHHALERALDVGAHVVIVSGEAGIGKTRLVQEFAGGPAPRQFRMLSASCHATEQPLPFRPWIDALRGEATTLDRDLPNRLGAASRRQLARVFPELSDGAPSSVTTNEHARLFGAMAELVESLAADEPTLIVLEDLHWADAMSVRLLAFLGRRLGALPVLIVGSARPEELIDAPALQQALTELRNAGRLDEIPLGGLTREESLTLARALRGSGRNRDVVDRIADDLWKLSEGNPLVIVESIRGLDPTGAGRPGLSPSIRDSVVRRLAHLPDRPRAALAAAAVIGQSFSFRLLHEVTGLDEMDAADAVEELVRRRVLDAVGERLDFYHDRIRQVVYEGLLPARRALLHRAVALALEAAHRDRLDDVADQLGQHFLRAGEAEKAIPYLLRVAELATRRYALDAASGALQQAMAATEQLSDLERDRCRLDIALRHGFVLALLGRQREVLDLLGAHGACLKRVADPVLTFEYYFRLTLTHLYLGEHSRGLLVAEQALREGERSGDLERLGKALHLLSYAGYGVGDPQAGIVYATRALPLLDRPHLQHYLVLAYHDLFLNHVVAGHARRGARGDRAVRGHRPGRPGSAAGGLLWPSGVGARPPGRPRPCHRVRPARVGVVARDRLRQPQQGLPRPRLPGTG